MIYLNTVRFSPVKSNAPIPAPVVQKPSPMQVDNLNFGKNFPANINRGSWLKKILGKIWGSNLVEKTVVDKFGHKSIEKYNKKGLLCEKVLFKKIETQELPSMILKYEDGKLIEAKGLRENGKAEFKRKYDKITGEQVDEIFYAEDGKTPSIFGL